MAAQAKQAQQLARKLLKASLADGAVSPERVAGVLEYVAKHRPANTIVVLKAYRRLVSTELAKREAIVEHAGAIDSTILSSIAAALTAKYKRPVTTTARPNPALIAGIRVHLSDDVYESSVAGQLAALGSAL